MAGARDIRDETTRIRREQKKRNMEAMAEREAAITAMEQRPSTHRRGSRPTRSGSGIVIRKGHRIETIEEVDPNEEFKMMRDDGLEDKMMTDLEDKDVEDFTEEELLEEALDMELEAEGITLPDLSEEADIIADAIVYPDETAEEPKE